MTRGVVLRMPVGGGRPTDHAWNDPAYMKNPLRQDLWRAGHAHAGVLVILTLLALRYVDEATLVIESLQLSMRVLRFLIVGAVLVVLQRLPALAQDDGQPVPREQYSNRVVLPDPTAAPGPDTPRSLMPIKDDLYRHTNTALAALHGGFVPITTEGAIVIDPALTCTDIWLRDEIQSRFNVSVRYIIYTHAHFDHIAGAQVFQNDGATVVTHKNAVEPIVAEKLPTAVPDRVFDKAMTITLGGDTVRLFQTRQRRTVDA
jgi:hypothetical protein